MKLLLPKEHGAWAMWIAPYLIGILLTEFKIEHIFMLIAVFFAYISIYPFLQGLRRPNTRKQMWRFTLIYLAVAAIFGLPILYLYPKIIFIVLLMIPSFLTNLYFLKRNNERAFINNLAALIPLNSTVLISYYIGTHRYDLMALALFLLIFLFFLSSVFYVKVSIRERDNKT
ncbi:MAG: YwiC-like family protein, partial [Bacillota bacterium]